MASAELNRNFLEQRQALLSQMMRLWKALEHNHHDLAEIQMQRFLRLLVDYISFGHFRILPVSEMTSSEYAAIDHTTKFTLNFNDRFADPESFDLERARNALDHLAELLETRFELEDPLLVRPAAIA